MNPADHQHVDDDGTSATAVALTGSRELLEAPPHPPAWPVDVRSDLDAMTLWLRGYEGGSAETVRAYRFEALRHLAWLSERKGPLDHLLPLANLDDGQSFVDWLQRPTELKAKTLRLFELARQPVWKAYRAVASSAPSAS